MVAFPSAALFSSPPSTHQRGDYDYPLSSSPASVNLLTPPPSSPETPIQTSRSSWRDSNPTSAIAGLPIFDLSLSPEPTMSSTSTPPNKRKHHQSTLGSAFPALSSNNVVAPTLQTEKVASDEKRRRISTGWDELCRATVRARQAEERRRASVTGNSPLGRARGFRGDTEAGSLKTSHTVNVRAEGSSLRTAFSPFKLELPAVGHKTVAVAGHAAEAEAEDIDMEGGVEKEDGREVSTMSVDEADIEEEDESSYATSRRRRSILGSGFGDTRIGHRTMTSNLRAGKRYQREHFHTLPLNHASPAGSPSYLELFNSHSLLDIYRAEPNPYQMVPSTREWSPAYTCAFSHSAKDAWTASEHSFAAIATECGGVRIFDTNKSDASIPQGWEAGERIGSASTSSTNTAVASEKKKQTGPKPGLFAPHANAIYDIKWSADDTMLTTACADQSTGIWDTNRTSATYQQSAQNNGLITKLRGHTASVKTSIWHDRNTIATAGRDGDIHIYDLRTTGREVPGNGDSGNVSVEWKKRARNEGDPGDSIWPVLSIKGAHGIGPIKKERCSNARSVTCLVPLEANSHHMASGGSADGIIKLWDLRVTHRSRKFISEPAQLSPDRTLSNNAKRSRGIIHMVAAPKNGMIYALSSDSRITAYSQHDLTVPLPITYAHPNLTAAGFYLRLALSPCEKYIGCGSRSGSFYAWSAGQNTRNHLTQGSMQESVVQGLEVGKQWHRRELSAVDWGHDQIMTCSDDCSTRIWRPSRAAYDAIVKDPQDASYDWAGVNI